MAEAAPVDQSAVQCGFCLQRGGLKTSKFLPCSHIHCQTCLTDNYDVYGVVRCPWCREVYDVTVDSLPSADVREDNSPLCDVCTKKGIKNQSAVTFCTFCSKLYCTEHQELHDALFDDHHKLTVDEYKQKARKLEIRVCADHKECPYSLGCKVCATLLCVQCVPGIGVCTDGSAHQLVNIDDLVRTLTTVDELVSREDELSALFTLTSKSISDFDTETEKSLATLHKHRDQQPNAPRLKYEKLEKDLVEGRRKTKSDMTKFMEEDVGVKWSDMSRNRTKVEAQLKHSHQVDIVRGYTKIKHEIETFLSDELPKLELPNVMTLEVRGQEERRDIEVELVSAEDRIISLGEGITIYTLPKSLTLLQTVPVSSGCYTACMYKGITYVVSSSLIDRIDENYQLSKSLITAGSSVYDVTVYKEHIYALVYGIPWTVAVHDLTGKLVRSWTLPDSSAYANNQLVIVNNQVVVPDRLNKQLTMYSLAGEVNKHLPCALLCGGVTAICAVDSHSVVVSDQSSSKVFKVDTITGKIIWISDLIQKPQGVVCYRSKHVLVTKQSTKTTIWVLDVKTGNLLTQLTDPSTGRSNSNVYDLHISGNTLIVPRFSEKKVLFYQLK